MNYPRIKTGLAKSVRLALGAMLGVAVGLFASERAAAENFYGLGSFEDERAAERRDSGLEEIRRLREAQRSAAGDRGGVFDAVENTARERVARTRAEAAVEAQRQGLKNRAERSMFGEAPSISGREGGSISDAPSASISDAPGAGSNEETSVEQLPDGRMRVHTRLGKFGPKAAIVMPPMKFAPREPNEIVRYTESGIPVSARRDRAVKKSREIADRYFADMRRKIEAGEMEPPPKRKTQAEIWAEKNAEVLERRKKYGRETSENFVIAGTTPEQSKLYYRDSTYITYVDGKAVPVVDAPQDQLPEGWLSKDEYEKARSAPNLKDVEVEVKTVPVKAADRGEENGYADEAPRTVNDLSDYGRNRGRARNSDRNLIREFFPDMQPAPKSGPQRIPAGAAAPAKAPAKTPSGNSDIEAAFPDRVSMNGLNGLNGPSSAFGANPSFRPFRFGANRTPEGTLKSNTVTSNDAVNAGNPESRTGTAGSDAVNSLRTGAVRVLETIAAFAFGANAAQASGLEDFGLDESELRAFENSSSSGPAHKGLSAFDDIAKKIAEDKKRIERGMNAADEERRKRLAEEAARNRPETEGDDCSQCRLPADAAAWAAEFAKERRENAVRSREDFYGDSEQIEAESAATPEERALYEAALALPDEMRTVGNEKSDEESRKALEAVEELVGDPSHPASFLSALRKGLEENPVVLDYVPDAAERLGMLSPEEEAACADPLGTGTLVFVSFSLGDEELKDLFARNAGKKDTSIVFRGIPDGMSFADGVKHIQGLAAQFDPMPNVVIDPTLFRDLQIKSVPTVARIRERPGKVRFRRSGTKRSDAPELVAKASGLHSDVWVKSQIEAGNTGDLGQQGEVREILERDLIEVAKERVMKIDWEAKKERAAKRAWATLSYEHLPTAKESAVRTIDPTILVERDILDLNGNPIRRAGDRVNPMDIRPFTLALVVFNPLVESELQTVEKELPKLKREHPQVMLLATDMVKDETGWDAYVRLTDRLDSHVFLLTPEVRERFLLRATPSVVTGDNERRLFVVREIVPSPVSSAEQGRRVVPVRTSSGERSNS